MEFRLLELLGKVKRFPAGKQQRGAKDFFALRNPDYNTRILSENTWRSIFLSSFKIEPPKGSAAFDGSDSLFTLRLQLVFGCEAIFKQTIAEGAESDSEQLSSLQLGASGLQERLVKHAFFSLGEMLIEIESADRDLGRVRGIVLLLALIHGQSQAVGQDYPGGFHCHAAFYNVLQFTYVTGKLILGKNIHGVG